MGCIVEEVEVVDEVEVVEEEEEEEEEEVEPEAMDDASGTSSFSLDLTDCWVTFNKKEPTPPLDLRSSIS